ncbi:metabotropic glutamate receptor 6-like [Mizuhopecten yessoensis]|uniref:metabotropic glutamate receptor 6-like n=1 Tax=Mizuhopecten yessoensis TaxID=6573 RepID=UPI000B45AA95|nr:metabotropic glutamate receptor 6-like [Mizuhopecten yessoensis]XP_021346803.1 metabotropic glutamate receptor 6-like [Mizuhopecten yessoensis]XP_021346804.1 metabotropic glutamate receptor 6-like [Mizuhopecten yessoensis]
MTVKSQHFQTFGKSTTTMMAYLIGYEVFIIIFSVIAQPTHGILWANVSGDVFLGGLFPIHRATDNGRCGGIHEQDGIQTLETAVWTLKQINDKSQNLKIGLVSMDTCETDTVALENALEFVSMDGVTFDLDPAEDGYVCRDGSIPYRNSTTGPVRMGNRAVGVVGAAFSQVSIAVASFLRLFKVPQISYWSTSPELSDKGRFSFFKRTVPSDAFQARVIVNILTQLEWWYVVAVYEQTTYGANLYFEMKRLAEEEGICFGLTEEIKLSKVGLDDELETIAHRISDAKNTHGKVVVILITHYGLAKSLFQAVDRKSLGDKVRWIGVDAWAGRQFDETIQQVVSGAIAVQPLARKLKGFDEYFTSLTPATNTWNPWFQEYWEFHFNCKLSDKSTSPCTGKEQLSAANGYEQLQSLYYVQDAVTAFADALHKIHQDACGLYYRGICPNMATKLTGETLLTALDNIEFIDPLGFPFQFINGTDGPPRYSIMMYRKNGDKFQWQEIGNFTDSDGLYRFDIEKLPYNVSVCSSVCDTGEERRVTASRPCCWYCKQCTKDQYVSDEFTCETCPQSSTPNNLRNACHPLPLEFVSFGDPVAIFACVFSSVGILLCLFVLVIYIRFRSTPIVKASGIELSFVLLAGIVLSYGATFMFMAKPSPVICGFRRTLLGVCYTVCYATILTKTNRIYRIFSMKENAKILRMKRFTSSKSSLVITILLCAIELVAIVVWLIFDPPKAVQMDYKTGDAIRNVLVCHDSMDFSYIGVLIYPFILMIICIVYAVKTRKTPDGFNETKFITFCSTSTFIIWVAFIPTYFATSNSSLRVASLTMSLLVNATVILTLLFLRKIYIVLFRPMKNTREKVMSRASLSHDLGDSNCSNVQPRPASTYSISRQDVKETVRKVNGIKAEVVRMDSEGFSVPSPGIGSLGMSLSGSQMLLDITGNVHENNENSSRQAIHVLDGNVENGHSTSPAVTKKGRSLKVILPEIKLNDIPLST